jgi:hypothetical protein
MLKTKTEFFSACGLAVQHCTFGCDLSSCIRALESSSAAAGFTDARNEGFPRVHSRGLNRHGNSNTT